MFEPVSVGEITAHIRMMLESDSRLQDVWVTGEVSNFKQAASGHLYFSLKDSRAQIQCVMWRSNAARQTMIPRSGDAIVAHGYISVYDQSGNYQLYADRIRRVGIGDLYRQFEELKAKLEAEGLFDPYRKRPLPDFPRRIGVVTSADAAAFQDVQNVLRRRYPLVEILLSPCLVQGFEAPAQIVRALARLNAREDVDVILVCRGGGSIEDLWAFNDEGVARAIAASRVPVISGVGHETDFTIADFVADVRAPTPSAAAELLTPDILDLRDGIDRLNRILSTTLTNSFASRRKQLADSAWALRQVSPMVAIRASRQRLDDWNGRMASAQRGRLALLRERLRSSAAALSAVSPQAVLERGYAIVSADGKRITSANALHSGMDITVQFHDGTRRAKVNDD